MRYVGLDFCYSIFIGYWMRIMLLNSEDGNVKRKLNLFFIDNRLF